MCVRVMVTDGHTLFWKGCYRNANIRDLNPVEAALGEIAGRGIQYRDRLFPFASAVTLFRKLPALRTVVVRPNKSEKCGH